MTYLDYISNNKERISIVRQEGFLLDQVYSGRILQLKDIHNDCFQKCLNELSGIPLTREYVKGQFKMNAYTGFVATMLWGGLGLTNWNQLVSAMSIEKKEVENRINNLQKLLREDKIQDAFMSLQKSRDKLFPQNNKFAGVDISYFTKLLYFLYDGKSDVPPIIFDKWGTFIHAGILISQKEIGLLKTYYKMDYDEKRKFYIAIKSNRSTGYRYKVYEDYIKRIASLASLYAKDNPGLLEEFLFGKDLKHRGNKNDDNPRFFVSKYVKDFFDKHLAE